MATLRVRTVSRTWRAATLSPKLRSERLGLRLRVARLMTEDLRKALSQRKVVSTVARLSALMTA